MTRYDFLRRRIAPVAFGVAIVLMARESCQKEQRTHATMVLDFGAAEPRVQGVDAWLSVEGEELSHFHQVPLPGGHIGAAKFKVALPKPDGTLHLDIDLGDQHVTLDRRFHADEDATVTVPLGDELTARASAPGGTP